MTNIPPPPPGFSSPYPPTPQRRLTPVVLVAVLVTAVALVAAAVVTAVVVMRGGDKETDGPGPTDTVTATVTRSEPTTSTTEQREEAAATFVREALPELLGYDYRNLTALEIAAGRYLAGEVHDQFLRLLDTLRTTATENHVVTVLSITSLRVQANGDDGRFTAVVVGEQRITNRSTSTPTTQRVSMEVTVVEEDGEYRITDITTV